MRSSGRLPRDDKTLPAGGGMEEGVYRFSKTTNSVGIATVDIQADITSGSFEVRARMDDYRSDWVLVSC